MAAIEGRRRQDGFALPLAIRFFFAMALMIVLAVAAAIVVTYVQGKRIADRAIGRTLTTSEAAQREFEQHRLEQLELSLRLVASDASFVKYIADANSTSDLPGLGGDAAPDTMSMRDLLGDRQKDIGFSLGILLDGKGEVLARTDQTEAFTESLAGDALVAPALAQTQPLSGYWRLDGKLYQAAIVPLAQDQAVVGFLLLAQSVDDALARKVAQVSGAEIAFWMPLGGKPTLVATSLDAPLATALRESVAAAGLPARAAGGGTHLNLGGQDWVARTAPTAAADAADLGQVMVLSSSEQVVASYRAILNSVLLGGLVTMLLALPLSYLISKGILRPVSAMAAAAEQAAAGNFQTRLGTQGSDELARLSRAFDSLLSDLREKSDMEGYVGNLARFLPEPGQEGSGVTVHTQPLAVAEPARRDTAVLLGLEYRHLLTAPAQTPADVVVDGTSDVQARLAAIAARRGALCLRGPGARWTLAFSGPQRLDQALAVLRDELALSPPPAAALADGSVVLVPSVSDAQLIGAVQVQIDRLLCDAAPGQALAGRSSGEALRSEFGADAVSVATGGFSGKQYYATTIGLLQRLPATALQPPDDGNATLARDSTAATPRPPATPARPSRDTGELAPGATLGGRYRVLSILGAGGMGVVYKAHDLELDDVVALKMLKPGALLDAEQLDRLKSEIKLARRITHPNVLRTFDFGEVNGLPYISMEYVRGMTLRYLLREAKRVPYSAGLRIARQLAAGLAAAHEVGVLHRDIKPENLILEANGNAKLMDFGIARPARRATPGYTQPGTFLGTPNYCAPEQLAGEEVDERADIYSCGVLMTEMFCGALPYSGSNTMEIYMAQMQAEPTRPSVLWPEIRPELEALILACLKRHRDERPASAAELAASLAQLRA